MPGSESWSNIRIIWIWNRLEEEIHAGRQETEKAKSVLKVAKEARAQRQEATPDEEEQAAMVRESQYQKAELKRLEKYWKNRVAVLQQRLMHMIGR